MRLTESKLKQIILETMNEELLQEEAKGPLDLPEGIKIKVYKRNPGIINIFYADESGEETKYTTAAAPYGVVVLDTKVQSWEEFPCQNAMMVGWSDTNSGWGPMLYDVAMEVATLEQGGLVSDRTEVSTLAYRVWDFYLKDREDVEARQLDEDECLQGSSYDHSGRLGIPWNETATSKIYTKEPTTLKALRDSGKLILSNIELNF